MAQERRRQSIRTRTAVALGVIAVALPIAGAAAVASVTRDAMAERALEGQLATARAVASQTERSIDFAVDLLQQGARRPGLSAWMAVDDRDGQREVLENLSRIDLYRTLATYGPDQRLRVAEPRRVDVDEDVEWGLESFLSEPVRRNGDSVIVVREPVVVEGEVVGYLAGEVSLDHTVFGFTSLRFGSTGALSLVDTDGDVLLSGDPARRQTRLSTPALRALAKGHEPGTAEYRSVRLDREEVGAYTPVEGTDWGVLATRATSEVFADIDNLERALMVGVAVVVVLGLGITVLMWRNVSSYEERLDADQRAIESAARELERTNAEVEEANQALREFVAVAAHDLRGPLTSVSGFAELLRLHEERLTPDKRAEYVATILHQSDVMGAIVDDLLTISQIEAGHMDVDRSRVAVRPAVQQVVSSFGDGGHEVALECQAGIEVLADPRHVDRMVRNYVSNAFKYGAPPVRVVVTAVGGWVEVRVCDGGRGVPEEFVPRLFQKFSRSESARVDKPGTGLGLSIVQGLARLNGGDAWYEPNRPTGSCFVVRLPEATEADDDASRPDDKLPVGIEA